MSSQLKITQIQSAIGRKVDQKRTLRALGISKMHQTVIQEDTAPIRGMIAKVRHLLKVEAAQVQERDQEIHRAKETT